MKVLVLNAPKNLQEVVSHLPKNVTLVSADYVDIEFVISHKEITILHRGQDILNYDYVWITASWSRRDIAYVLSLYLSKNNRKHSIISEGHGNSKLVDMTLFTLSGIRQPKTYYTPTSDLDLNRIIEVCGLPVVGKSITGTRGRNSFLAKTKEELQKFLKASKKRSNLFFQEYIENDYDWGVIVANLQVVSGERSYRTEASTTFMNHSFSGAIEQFSEVEMIPEEIANIARDGHKALDLDWGRADIVVSKKNDKAYLLEVNRSPRMTSDSSEVSAYATYLASVLDL